MRKKFNLTAIVCVSLFLQFLTCAASASAKLQIGVIIPLSGVLTEYGNAVRNAFELAKLDYPDVFDSVILSYEDSLSEPKNALAAFEKLASSKVDCRIRAEYRREHISAFRGLR